MVITAIYPRLFSYLYYEYHRYFATAKVADEIIQASVRKPVSRKTSLLFIILLPTLRLYFSTLVILNDLSNRLDKAIIPS